MANKILFVFGTRPEVIKMAPVIKLAKEHKKLNPVICVTAQHRYLLDQALKEFDIKPDMDLDLMRPDQTLYDIISGVTRAMKRVYHRIRPDLVLVQGDTSTVFAASLAAYYEGVDVGHIEAGLRSGDNRNPFPEEINRRFVSLVARYNFCPTRDAKGNLLREGTGPHTIFVTGNTAVDSVSMVLKEMEKNPPELSHADRLFMKKPYVLITGHRRESFDSGMKNICMAIKSLASEHPGYNWLWAVHLNPTVRRIVFGILSGLPSIRLVEPVPYRAFVYLMQRSEFLISDSGGIQEEAPSMGKTVFVTRACTERPEALKAGTSILVGTDSRKIQEEVNGLIREGKVIKKVRNPFGDGNAAKRIVDVIVKGHCREFQG